MEDIKKAILEFAESSKKTKFYFSDIEKAVQKTMPDKKAREIKANILTKNIPIVAVTAHALPKDRERALAAGCDAFIIKPFSIAKLLAEIEDLTDW